MATLSLGTLAWAGQRGAQEEAPTIELQERLEAAIAELYEREEAGIDVDEARRLVELVSDLRERNGTEATELDPIVAKKLTETINGGVDDETLTDAGRTAPRIFDLLPAHGQGMAMAILGLAKALGDDFHDIGRPEDSEALYRHLLPRFQPFSVYRSYCDRQVIRALRDQGRLAATLAFLEQEQERGATQIAILLARSCDPPIVAVALDILRQAVGLDGTAVDSLLAAALVGRAASNERLAGVLLDTGLTDRAAVVNAHAQEFLDASGEWAAEMSLNVMQQRLEILLAGGRYEECIAACDDPARAETISKAKEDKPNAARDASARLLLTRGVAERTLGRFEDSAATFAELLAIDGAPEQDRWSAHQWRAEIGLVRPDVVDPLAERRALQTMVDTGSASWSSPINVARLCSLDAAIATGTGENELARLEEAVDALIESWARLPAREGGHAFLRNGHVLSVLGELFAAKRRSSSETTTCEYVLEWIARVHSLGELGRALDPGPFDVRSFRTVLAESGVGVLVYLPGPRHSFVLAVDGEDAVLDEIPERHGLIVTLMDLARRARSDASAPVGVTGLVQPGEMASAGLALLPERIRSRIETWHSVGIVGSELLAGFPMETLELNGVPFGESHAIGYVPSLPTAVALAERARATQRPTEHDAVILAGIRHGSWAAANAPRLRSLDLAVDDLERIGRSLGPDRTEVRFAADADIDGIRACSPDATRQLIIVSHGYRLPGDEQPAAVLLDQDPKGEAQPDDVAPLLHADLVRTLDAPPLVVVAACGAGFEPLRHGDAGAAGMTGAWLVSGATTVVQPRGDLPLGPTLAHLEFFEEALADQASVAEALRASRVRVREALDVPLSGALLHAVGWPFEPIVPARRGARALPIVIGALLAAALGLGLTRRRRAA
ncbi:MAG: CHAT domain-containing protein [Planctomycetota bacterium]